MLRHAWSVIGDDDDDLFVLHMGSDFYPAIIFLGINCFQCILKQVYENLFKPDGMTDDAQFGRRQCHVELVHSPGKTASQQYQSSRNNLAERGWFGRRTPLSRKRFQIASDGADAIRQCGDFGEIVSRIRKAFSFNEGFCIVCISANGRHRLVDFMRDARRDLSHDGETIGMDKILLHPLQHRFGAPVIADLCLQPVSRQTEVAGAFFNTLLKFHARASGVGNAGGKLLFASQEETANASNRCQNDKCEQPGFSDCGRNLRAN